MSVTDPDISGLAAVDLGSNSFHMLIARLQGDEPVTVDRLREQVQLAADLDAQHNITPKAWRRSIDCLNRFGQRLRGEENVRVRAVGTNSLRVAHNAAEFRAEAEAALGHPIEIISGQEEARLIYLGVAHLLSDDSASRLVIDIGGGSTECIVGERFEAVATHSFYMGCVRYTQRFFPDGEITRDRMTNAVLAAQLELQSHVAEFRGTGWTEAVGASGTIRAIAAVAVQNGWCEQALTAKAVRCFRKELVTAGHPERVGEISGMKPARAPIIAGGAAILQACFDSFGIESMNVAHGALKEGVLYDLLGRIQHEDVRVRTIRLFQQRYQVDHAQAVLVEQTALALLARVTKSWDMDANQARPCLSWSARLHEVGLAVSYDRHHRHGAYLIENSDMPGFSRDDQQMLAMLIACHRRRLRPEHLERLRDGGQRTVSLQILVLLRLAVLLNRGRTPGVLPQLAAKADADRLTLLLPSQWLLDHPLAVADLERERSVLQEADIDLRVQGV
jgi:exopolyphosphatase/guanosine-5'-triphosphate,3'-diphosphate pyrophosphatase